MSSTLLPQNDAAAGRYQAVNELLGGQLRHFRSVRGIGRDVAGRHIGGSEPKISRLELGRVRVKEDDLERLLELYRVAEPERRGMRDIARRLSHQHWWDDYKDVVPGWLSSYLLLESAARVIRTYEVQFIPGLLQTRAYAEAVIRLRYARENEVRRRVDVRIQRQRMLREQRSPVLWAVIDEAALRQQIGGPQVMREQLESLARANERSNVRIQILRPNGAGVTGNSFSILRMPNEHVLDIVYLEQIDSALFFTDRDKSDPYVEAMERIGVAAKPPQETAEIIEEFLQGLSGPGQGTRTG